MTALERLYEGRSLARTHEIAEFYGVTVRRLFAIAKQRGIVATQRRGWVGASYVWTIAQAAELDPRQGEKAWPTTPRRPPR